MVSAYAQAMHAFMRAGVAVLLCAGLARAQEAANATGATGVATDACGCPKGWGWATDHSTGGECW